MDEETEMYVPRLIYICSTKEPWRVKKSKVAQTTLKSFCLRRGIIRPIDEYKKSGFWCQEATLGVGRCIRRTSVYPNTGRL